MKQLIKLAQALAHGPQLLILDEPTNGLDPMARQRMIQTLQQIRKEGSIHLLISSHLLRDIDQTCDEVLILKDGRIAALCNIEEERRSHRNLSRWKRPARRKDSARSLRSLGCECASFPDGRIKLVMPDAHRAPRCLCGRGPNGHADPAHPSPPRLPGRHLHARHGDRAGKGGPCPSISTSIAPTRPLTPLWSRVGVLVRYALAEAWSSRITMVLFLAFHAARRDLPYRHLFRQ